MVSKALHLLSETLHRISHQLGGRSRVLAPPLSYHDLLERFGEPGCAVCTLLLRDADRFIDNMLYELALDPGVRQAVRMRLGLCAEHSASVLQHRGMSLGIALLYQVALDEVLRIMAQTSVEQKPRLSWPFHLLRESTSPLAEALEPAGHCIVCGMLAGAEKHYLRTLGQHAADPRLRDAFLASDGLCIPHFRQALLLAETPANRKEIVDLQQAVLSRLKADLDGLINKSSYLHRHEITDRESNSWLRVTRVVGQRGVFGPDRRTE